VDYAASEMLVSHLVHTGRAMRVCAPAAEVCGPRALRLGTGLDGDRAIVCQIDT